MTQHSARSADTVNPVPAAVTMRGRGRLAPLRRMGADTASITAHVSHSPNYRDGRFRSPEPTSRPSTSSMPRIAAAAWRDRERGRPAGLVPIVAAKPPLQPGALAVTWYGHATTLVEVDGARFLLDPVFGQRASPVSHSGPQRLHPTPGRIEDIPTIDAVVISHDHYDHLDEPSITRLERSHRPHYVVPLGVDLHLRAWGVANERITALDWFDSTERAGIRLTATPARHNSGRGLTESQTLWCGWALQGPEHSVWFTGDSGPSSCFTEIGERLGPFDLTIVPVGAYDVHWPDIHVNPDEAVAAHVAVNGADAARRAVLLPVHWATFNLARHRGRSRCAGSVERRSRPASRSPTRRWATGLTSPTATPSRSSAVTRARGGTSAPPTATTTDLRLTGRSSGASRRTGPRSRARWPRRRPGSG